MYLSKIYYLKEEPPFKFYSISSKLRTYVRIIEININITGAKNTFKSPRNTNCLKYSLFQNFSESGSSLNQNQDYLFKNIVFTEISVIL